MHLSDRHIANRTKAHPKPIGVVALKGVRLNVSFDDGTGDTVDLSNLAKIPRYRDLGEFDFFKKIKISTNGDLVWSDRIKIRSLTIHRVLQSMSPKFGGQDRELYESCWETTGNEVFNPANFHVDHNLPIRASSLSGKEYVICRFNWKPVHEHLLAHKTYLDSHPECADEVNEARDWYAERGHHCPYCGRSPWQVTWFFSGTDSGYFTGKAGWMTICEPCQLQVDFFLCYQV
jgi:hypothetical protein